MKHTDRIYIPGHLGMVGSAIQRNLQSKGYKNFVSRSIDELDLTRQADVETFFENEKPEYVFVAAAKVGGIIANNVYRAQFIYENLMIQNNIIHAAYKSGVKKLLFLGSSCIYPKNAPQPLKEEYLLTGLLEPTNEPYAIAKIAGIKMCESYFRQYGKDFISVMPTNLYGPNDNYDLEKSHVLPALIRKMHLGKCLMNGDWAAIRNDFAKRPSGIVEKKVNDGEIEQWNEQKIINILERFGIRLQSDSTIPTLHHSITPSPPRSVAISLWGTGNVYREFLHVEDMADACVYIMLNVGSEKLYNQLNQTHINIGTGIDLTIRDLAGIVQEVTSFEGMIDWDSSKPDGTPKKQLDVSLLNQLGWKPDISLRDGIEKVYQNFLSD